MKRIRKDMSPGHLLTIQKVAKKLATKFSYFEREDVEQELFIFCFELFEKWDGDRPLENFLMVTAKKRLLTFIRENYYRASDPEKLTGAKKAAQNFMELYDVFEDDFTFDLDNQEELDNILEYLPPFVRADFLRLAQGVKIPATRKQKVYEMVREYGQDR